MVEGFYYALYRLAKVDNDSNLIRYTVCRVFANANSIRHALRPVLDIAGCVVSKKEQGVKNQVYLVAIIDLFLNKLWRLSKYVYLLRQ